MITMLAALISNKQVLICTETSHYTADKKRQHHRCHKMNRTENNACIPDIPYTLLWAARNSLSVDA